MKEIKGLKDYFATTDGKIYSKRSGKLKELKGYDNNGYRQIECYGKCYKVHRLIALTFIPTEDESLQINHINGVKNDNRVENLEWCNNSHNQKHAWAIGLQKKRKPTNRALTDGQAKMIREEYANTKTSHGKLADKYGVSKTTIGDILRGNLYGSNKNYKSNHLEYRRSFTLEQAEMIRKEHKETNMSYRAMARKYNVDPSTISDIIRNKSYVK